MIWHRLLIRSDRTITDRKWYPIFDQGVEELPLAA